MKKIALFLAFAVLFLSAACSMLPANASDEVQVVETGSVEQPDEPMSTQPPEPAAVPTATPTPEPVPEEIVEAVEEPVTGPDFSLAKFRSMSYLKDGLMLIVLVVPGENGENCPALVAGTTFNCKPDGKYPGKLFCVGPEQIPGAYTLQVFSNKGNEVVFEIRFTVQPKP